MNCVIILADEKAIDIIEKLISNNKNVNLNISFKSPIEGIKYLNENSVDLIFLCIELQIFSGFDFLQMLKHPPKTILVSYNANSVLRAFEYNCVVDYLKTPVSQERFDKSIEKAKLFFDFKKEFKNLPTSIDIRELKSNLYVNVNKRLLKISFDSINFIEAKGDYILIKTDQSNHLVHSSLKNIEKKLPKGIFLKIHRSYIINLEKITLIDGNTLLIGEDKIPISRLNKPTLMKEFNLL